MLKKYMAVTLTLLTALSIIISASLAVFAEENEQTETGSDVSSSSEIETPDDSSQEITSSETSEHEESSSEIVSSSNSDDSSSSVQSKTSSKSTSSKKKSTSSKSKTKKKKFKPINSSKQSGTTTSTYVPQNNQDNESISDEWDSENKNIVSEEESSEGKKLSKHITNPKKEMIKWIWVPILVALICVAVLIYMNVWYYGKKKKTADDVIVDDGYDDTNTDITSTQEVPVQSDYKKDDDPFSAENFFNFDDENKQ